jgi:Tfp pilus assembly protein PilF
MLDILLNEPSPKPEMLLRAGYLNSLGHNLDIPGSAEKSSAIFQRLLAVAPSDPRANYTYGTFLAGVGKFKEAIPYLETATAAGVKEAPYTLGMTHLSLGDKVKALANLEAYRQHNPNDQNITKLIDSIRNRKLELRNTPN